VSAWHRNPAWPGLRTAAKRRDGWRCVRCGARGRLEVDHVQPVTRRPDLAMVLENLQTLCRDCHIDKTKADHGANDDPEKQAWRMAIKDLARKPHIG